jgi:outer membrane protein
MQSGARRSIEFLLWTAAAYGAAGAALAQAPRVGYVNGERLIHESPAAKAAEAKLKAEFFKREQELHDLTLRLQQANDRLDQDSPSLAEEDRTRRQRELIALDREVRRRRREFQDDLARRKEQELALLLEHANQIMKAIGQSEGYDFILEQGQYHSSRIDLTDKVINRLSAQGSR